MFRRFNSLSSSDHAKNPTTEDWAELERVVNEEYPGFTNRLMGFCNISSNELRVSLLLKINVSPSRIAILQIILRHQSQPHAEDFTRKLLIKREPKGMGQRHQETLIENVHFCKVKIVDLLISFINLHLK